jgi:NADPH-dependent 7-cyano-7-deazaguanine reductase QueF
MNETLGGFHPRPDCTVGIGERLFEEMKPVWLRIGGYWYPRGGIPIAFPLFHIGMNETLGGFHPRPR